MARAPEARPEKSRTFSFSELAVRTKWRKTRTAELVSRTLLKGRDEDLVVLLVDLEHPKVQDMYESWGFGKSGTVSPSPTHRCTPSCWPNCPCRYSENRSRERDNGEHGLC